ncbi:unnamed protein product [Prorocentrum cordatum]|uniref:Fibronectin type-III domain-containing protein n=1 Tax=Prorocentrum cordatum TaxID=2364126 RepID=A0ABN9TKK0_9DINO|nr:unnamed protein product [Polarella glacialis]
MPEAPALVAAGSTSLLLSWAAPEAFEALEVELRRSAWAWPLSAPWVRQATAPEDVRITDRFVEVTLRGLEPSTAYEVRIAAACEEGPRQVGPAAAFRTLAVAPPLLGPPSASCCRHDRLLLQWVEPAVQADEVIAYRVRYWDCEQRWPTKVEVEAKLTSRLLPPSQQTAQFLGGQAAMRIPRPPRGGVAARPEDAAAVEEDAGSEVHLWLMSLAPLRMYIVQVAAVTAAGTGEWSPKSTELFTWRSAPDLLPASRVCRTHSALALGLAVEPVPDGTEGQDEEVERFEVVVRPVQSGRGPAPDAAEVVVTAAEAAELALRLAGGAPSPGARPHAVAVRGLQPRSIYRCTARAITHAGVGSWSPAVELETLAVPPDVDDLRVDEADHCSAVLSWRVLDECPQAGLLRALLGEEEAERELWARRLVGFRVRSGGPAAGALKEILGARSRPAPDGRHRLALRDLAPNSAYQVEVAAAARGSEDGTWSGPVQVLTEGLAPGVPAPALLCASRRGAAVHWAAPDAAAAAVLGYVVQLRRRPEHRGRPPDPEERAFPLAGAGEGGEAASRDVAICDGSSTRVELRDLEPGATYLVQVAARTARGVGSWSEECLVSTRSRAPAMSQEAEPRLLHAYYDKLVLLCGGPVPDWPPEEASDVTGYRVRYFECSRSGWHGAWVEPAPHHLEVTETEDQAGCPAVQVCLRGLAPERQHVVQVAAVTAAGQGPWSPQSGRLSTWRVAPRMALPRVLFRTHEALVLGWTQDFQELEAGSADGTAHDEDIAEFLVRAAPSSAGRAEAKTVRASCAQAQALAAAWRDRLASEPEQVERQGLWRQRSRSGSADAVRCGPRWPDTMLCEAENDQWSPAFVAVVRGLAHGSGYSCTVSAASRAGEGQCSAASGEVSTLALAPVVEDARVDEVQHDQILISWELPQREPPLPPAAAEQLGLVGSLEELSLQGFSVRCAAWASWTRLSWREPCYTEVDALQSAGDAGRVHFALLDLEAASQYVAEVRAHSACGAGEWLRVGDQPICTAIVAEPPEKPELVYATSHALTFSFDGVEDRRVTAYEARRHERIAGTWTRASKPLKFDRNTIAVRVTPENRWVVKLDQLRSASDYAIQLRGITSTGGITKWSALSEFMRTRDDDGEADVDEGVGVHDASPASTASKQERAAAEQEKARQEAGIESVDDLARKLEAVLSVTMDYATRGVSLPGTKGTTLRYLYPYGTGIARCQHTSGTMANTSKEGQKTT